MAVTVTSANTNTLLKGSRVVIRTSAGIPYIVVEDTNDGGIEVWKGNSTTPTSFTEQDSSNNPQSSGRYTAPSAAIDSTGIIHIVYGDNNGKTSGVRYVQFSTSTDTFSGDVSLDAFGTAPVNYHTSIAIDSNDVPHAVYLEAKTNMGADYDTIIYNNRIGGAWNSNGINVDGGNNLISTVFPQIAIDSNNLPVIAYINSTGNEVKAAIGDANDALTWTLQTLDSDASQTVNERIVSLVVDSSGNHYVAYEDHGDGFIYLIKHNSGDSWATWQTRTTGSDAGINPTATTNGSDIYVFYEDPASNDIYYEKVTGGSTWGGDSLLETGTYQNVKAKWGFWVERDSTGTGPTVKTYYFDVSDAAATDPDGIWSNDSNAFDGSTSTYASTNSTGSQTTNELKGEGVNAPASGGIIYSVRARAFGGVNGSYSWGSWTTLSTPSGGWTWAKIQALEVKFFGINIVGDYYVTSYYYTDGEAELLGNIVAGGVSATDTDFRAYRSEVEVTCSPFDLTELDYAFSNGTNILFNSLALTAGSISSNVFDSITLTESVSVSLSAASSLDINVNDTVAVSENTTTRINYLNVSVSDSTTVTDQPNTVEIFEPTRFINVSDSITTSESVTTLINQLVPSVNDTITLSEQVSDVLTSYINSNDNITLSESTTTLINYLNVDVSDTATITESVDVDINIFINPSDNITVTENVSVLINQLYISVNDQITLDDSPTLSIGSAPPLNIDVFSLTTVTDQTTVFIPKLLINVLDNITTTENSTVVVNAPVTPQINVNDSISVTDINSVLIPTLLINQSDQTTVTDTSTVYAILNINVNDDVSTTDTTTTLINYLNIDSNDTITVTDSPTVSVGSSPPLNIDVFDDSTVTDSSTTLINQLVPFASDDITLSENTSVVVNAPVTPTINVSDTITLSESVSLIENISIEITKSNDWYGANWSKRVKITISSSQVGSTLTNFPVYVDLSELPADFHTNVKTDGSDIRVTTSNGVTELAREIVTYNSSTDTGELHFKADSISSTVDTDFYIYYGNSAANDYSVDHPYGRNNVWTQYQGVYHLQGSYDGTANEIVDSRGYNNGRGGNGTGTAVPTQVTGQLENGQSLDGGDYMNFGDVTNFDGATKLTLSAWVEFDSLNAFNRIISKWIGGGQQSFHLHLGGSGVTDEIQVAILQNISNYIDTRSNDFNLVTGTKYHIAAVWDGGTSIKLYKNGSEPSGYTNVTGVGSPTSINGSTEQLVFGGRWNSGSVDSNMTGDLDEMRLSTNAMSGDWIAAEYVNQSSTSTFYSVGSAETDTGLETISVTDAVTVQIPVVSALTIDVNDSVTITESTSVFIPTLYVDQSDSISVVDSPTVTIADTTRAVDVSDDIAVSESVQLSINSFVDVNDSISVTEDSTLLIPTLYVSVSDTATITDDVSATIENNFKNINVSDTISVSENVQVSIGNNINVNDQVTVTDELLEMQNGIQTGFQLIYEDGDPLWKIAGKHYIRL